MFSSTEEALLQIEEIYKEYQFVISYEIEEKTVSILKAKLIFNENLFIQVYLNIRRPKISFSLILNDIRLYGRDFLWGEWHRHPFESPDSHDKSQEGTKEVPLKGFFLEVLLLLEKEDLL